MMTQTATARSLSQRLSRTISASRRGAFAGFGVLLGGTLLAAGCRPATGVADRGGERDVVAALSAADADVPLPGGVAVSCASGQRTLVRQAVVDGQTVAHVACVGGGSSSFGDIAWGSGSSDGQTLPGSTRTLAVPAVYRSVAASDEVGYQRPARRAARRNGRSWQKSAVIIGSSAGVGAGVGALVSGKKGALIGAAVGGGGAAIWDQITRRRR